MNNNLNKKRKPSGKEDPGKDEGCNKIDGPFQSLEKWIDNLAASGNGKEPVNVKMEIVQVSDQIRAIEEMRDRLVSLANEMIEKKEDKKRALLDSMSLLLSSKKMHLVNNVFEYLDEDGLYCAEEACVHICLL